MASPLAWLDRSGDQLIFYVKALAAIPRTLRRYLKEVQRLLAEVAFGSGGLGVIGGTVGVMIAMTLFTGTVVGLQGYAALDQIGTAAFTGFVSAYFNTREIALLVAGLALSATVGAGFTAQLGAMRINEEVDALEGMGIRSMPYLVTTRIIAACRRHHPALRDRAALQLRRLPLHHRLLQRTVAGHLRPLLQPLPLPDRRPAVGAESADLQRAGDPRPLLLRLPRPGRPGRMSAWPSGGRCATPSC